MRAAGKNILLITCEFPPNPGGIGNHSYHLARSLSLSGYHVTVLADTIGTSESERQAFASLQQFKINWIPREKFLFKTYATRIVKALVLARKHPVIICSGKYPLWLGALIKMSLPRRKLIAVVHGSELDMRNGLPARMVDFSLARFHHIISVSGYTESFLPKTLPATIQRHIIHNGIDNAEFSINKPAQLEGEPAIITIGSVTHRKGQENVVNALPVIAKIYPEVRYHIVGKPVIKKQVKDLAKRNNSSGMIQFHGAVSRGELLASLGGAKVKMMLSNHTNDGDFEGFGIAVLEANALGIPAIGSQNSGIADAIDNHHTGILVDQKNPGAVANALHEIMLDYERYSANAKQWAAQHDWNIIVKKYIAVIED